MDKLKPCPFCGGKPKINRVGDQKEFVVYICSECYKTPVHSDEARITERGARKIWNRRVNDGQ
jgi:Lar family restriction alleviation protein